MALNIKNRDVEQLAHALADATGESLTQAVRAALEDRLARVRAARARVGLADDVARIQERVLALPLCDARSDDQILGHDADGLPS